MKKFAAIFISILLVATMAFGSLASAARVTDITKETGSLTLQKYEPDSNKTKGVQGAEFSIYKVLDLDENGLYKVAADFDGVTALEALVEDTADGGLTYNSTDSLENLIPALQSKAADLTATAKGSTNENGEYTFNDLTLGVYLVVETNVPDGYVASTKPFLVQIPQWNEEEGKWQYDITAAPKDDPIDIDKKIVEGEQKVGETTKEIGDTINFEVTADIPNYYDGEHDPGVNDKYPLTEDQTKAVVYKFTDTMSEGLTFVATSFEAKADVKTFTPGKKGTDGNWPANVDYQITTAGTTTITVEFNWASLKAYQGKDITLTYSAVLNENAAIGSANTNSVQLAYTNDPRSTSATEPKTTDKKETKVYTYGMNLQKKFDGIVNSAIDASGVEFSLKSAGTKLFFILDSDNPGTYTLYKPAMSQTFTANDDGTFTADPEDPVEATEGGKVTIGSKEYTITTKLNPTNEGLLTLKGLDGDETPGTTYVLTEENSIEGYGKLASDITIVVTASKDSNGLTGEAKVTMTGYTEGVDDNAGIINSADGIFSISVNNVKKQFDLPLTGGAGLLAFTIGGGIVIAGAVIIFSMLRKKRTSK